MRSLKQKQPVEKQVREATHCDAVHELRDENRWTKTRKNNKKEQASETRKEKRQSLNSRCFINLLIFMILASRLVNLDVNVPVLHSPHLFSVLEIYLYLYFTYTCTELRTVLLFTRTAF